MKNLSWKIGDVEITQLTEIEDIGMFNTFIPEASKENIKGMPWLIPNFATSDGELKVLVQSFLIKSNGKNILIDTCNGNEKERPTFQEWGSLNTNFLQKFDSVGVTPNDIDIVACTHLHFDHIGWNTKKENDAWVPTFPNATYLFSQKEFDYWSSKPEKEVIDDLNGIEDSIRPLISAGVAKFVSDDFQIDENVRFISTPGHTPHHVSVVIESNGQKAIISGDVLHHPCQIEHQDWITLADTYPDQTVDTRIKFLNEIADKEVLLLGSHFYYPVGGKVVRYGDLMRFLISSTP